MQNPNFADYRGMSDAENRVDPETGILEWRENRDFGPSASLFFGNGQYGGNVYVDSDGAVVILIGSTDSFRNSDGRLLKIGRLRIETTGAGDAAPRVSQRLGLFDGELRLRLRRGDRELSFRIYADLANPLIKVEIEGAAPFAVRVRLDNSWRSGDVLDSDDPELLAWHLPNGSGALDRALRERSLGELAGLFQECAVGDFGAAVWGSDGRTAGPGILELSPGCRRELWITPGLRDGVAARRARISAQPEAERWPRHVALWREFWDRSRLKIRSNAGAADFERSMRDFVGGEWRERLEFQEGLRCLGGDTAETVASAYLLQRYLMRCCGLGRFPAKFNGGIFYLDNPSRLLGLVTGRDPDSPAWGGHYWFQNTRLLYWAMAAAGDFDEMRVLFDFYRRILPLRRAQTLAYFGHGGAYFEEILSPDGVADGYGAPDSPARLRLPRSLAESPYLRYHWNSSLEVVRMAIEFYDYTRDAEFRTETLEPLADAVLEFFELHYPRDARGRIRITPTQALETVQTLEPFDNPPWRRRTQQVENDLPNVAGLRDVTAALTRLKLLPGRCSRLRKILPPLPTVRRGGKRRLDSAARHDSVYTNSENPELYAIFPFRLFGVPELFGHAPDLALESYRERVNRANCCWSQDEIQAACLGLADEAAAAVGRRARQVSRFAKFAGSWGKNNDECPDLDHAGVLAAALQNMLLQCRGRKMVLFPAWPAFWDVDFKLRAPDGTVVEGVLENGVLLALRVTPESRRKDLCIHPPASPAGNGDGSSVRRSR